MPTREYRMRKERKLAGEPVDDPRARGVKVNKDAVALLLHALGYPSTMPPVDVTAVSKTHALIKDSK